MSSPMRLRPSQVAVKTCETCFGTGLVEKSAGPPAQYAHEAFRTMWPCSCAAGINIRPAFESGKKEYESS